METTQDTIKKLKESMETYRKTMDYLGADMPIEVLTLPKKMLSTLHKGGFFRVYDFFGKDLTKIEGLGNKGIALLNSRLSEFTSMNV